MIFIRRILILLFMILMMKAACHSQSVLLDMHVTLNMNHKPLWQVMDSLRKTAHIFIAYSNALFAVDKPVTIAASDRPLRNVLEDILEGTGYTYRIFHNQIVLQPLPKRPALYYIKGFVRVKDSLNPIPYATISIVSRQTGVIADINGAFVFPASEEWLQDTLFISSIGYEPVSISLREMRNESPQPVYLKRIMYEIEPVIIEPENTQKVRLGNRKNRAAGSLYMDTHGQQVASFIEMEDGRKGTLKTLWYYLSEDGNADAPFRIRLYAYDTASGKPGNDLLQEMVVVKPYGKAGWYAVDLHHHYIPVSSPGFFIAMEGVFPNDYDFYAQGDDFTDIAKTSPETEIEDSPTMISYGQRLGYTKSRRNENNTWHYSLDHTWFQLKKQLFSVMVAADIIMLEKPHKEE